MNRSILVALCALSFVLPAVACAAAPTAGEYTIAQTSGGPNCRRLAQPGDDSIRIYCRDTRQPLPAATPGAQASMQAATASAQTSGDTSCRRFVPLEDTRIQTYCGNAAQWEEFDSRAVNAGVTCRWEPAPQGQTLQELCLNDAQWDSVALQKAEQPGTSVLAPRVDAEVIVSATRTLAELRKDILVADERFLAKYNELNKVPEFAIACDEEATTGSRFLRRTCRAEFVTVAIREGAQDWFRGNAPTPTESVGRTIESKKGNFHKNMIDLARQSPELVRLARERADLEQRYNQLLRRAFGSK